MGIVEGTYCLNFRHLNVKANYDAMPLVTGLTAAEIIDFALLSLMMRASNVYQFITKTRIKVYFRILLDA